jgi:hypothetical protein
MEFELGWEIAFENRRRSLAWAAENQPSVERKTGTGQGRLKTEKRFERLKRGNASDRISHRQKLPALFHR